MAPSSCKHTRSTFNFWCLLALILSLTGCQTDFSVYQVTEAELQNYVRDELRRLDREQLKQGGPLSIQVRESVVRIAPDDREVVELSLDGELALHALVARIPLDVKLKLEGVPVFEPEERALYIRRLNLLESDIQSDLLDGRISSADLAPAANMVVGSLARILERTPVYRFEESSFTGRLLQYGDMELKVVPGKLILVPGED